MEKKDNYYIVPPLKGGYKKDCCGGQSDDCLCRKIKEDKTNNGTNT